MVYQTTGKCTIPPYVSDGTMNLVILQGIKYFIPLLSSSVCHL